ncbi:MAG: radical SAM family heme chaperone HemW [Porticoccaceae bacterium]|nr:radical SAM family heme chaperone HemW [Porticoccaceae bacterium]
MLELPPLSLYVHIPWCVKKCPYCDFNSHAAGGDLPEDAYVAALIKDLQNDAELAQGRKLVSIFFGGGTPSLFSAPAIETIINAAQQIIGIAEQAEITLEANPGTFEQNKFSGYKNGGVNRLSIGIQSFNDQHLKALGRIHSGTEAIRAVDTAKQAGFDNFNLDLMHGLPGQTPDQALADVEQAIALEPSHLSWYQLTIEPNTVFYSSPPRVPDEPQLEQIQALGLAALQAANFEQYEVSAFAKINRQAVHNINYWQFGDYLGIGAGAHGKITSTEKHAIIRTQKTRQPQDYLARQGNYRANTRTLSNEELPVEFLMNALRLNQGVPKPYFSQRTGLDFDYIAEAWCKLEQQGLTKTAKETLTTTTLGHQFLNTVLAAF